MPGARQARARAPLTSATARRRAALHHRRRPIIILYTRMKTVRNKRRQQRGAGGERSPQERHAAPSSGARDSARLLRGLLGLRAIETRRKLRCLRGCHCHCASYTGVTQRTVVRAWLRVVVAVGGAMLSGGAGEARAGHGGLLLDTAVRPVRASAARAARHWAAHRPRPRPPPCARTSAPRLSLLPPACTACTGTTPPLHDRHANTTQPTR